MFGKTKYIVIEGEFGLEQMVIFGETQKHSDVANAFGQQPISAGFLTISAQIQEVRDQHLPASAEPTVEAWGHSVSLDLESRPEQDTKLAQQALGVAKELL